MHFFFCVYEKNLIILLKMQLFGNVKRGLGERGMNRAA
jgi:hypothetical protein